jgi:hypothetical protein
MILFDSFSVEHLVSERIDRPCSMHWGYAEKLLKYQCPAEKLPDRTGRGADR